MTAELKKANKHKVQIVDDDLVSLLLLRETLEAEGFNVIEARTGREALAQFDVQKPDLVLLDVMMPEMDGFEVCAEIRKRHAGRHTPILMVTGANDIASIKKAYEKGATDFVAKPFNGRILCERARYMLRSNALFMDLKKNQEMLSQAQRVARLGNWTWDADEGRFSFSKQFSFITGLHVRSAVSWGDFLKRIHPEDRSEFETRIQQTRHRGKAFSMDHRITCSDGSERIVSQTVEAHIDGAGNITRIFGALQDITERKMAELLELERNRILRMVVQESPIGEILASIVSVLEEQRPGALAAICLVQDEELQVAASGKLPKNFEAVMNGTPVGAEGGAGGLAAYLGQFVVTENIAESNLKEEFKQAAEDHEIRASLSAPIFSGKGRMLGVISLYYGKPHKASDDELRLVEKMGQLAALAIDQRSMAELLTHQAQHDALTGLLNRTALANHLKRYMSQAVKRGSKGAVLLIDLDRFKRVNDSMGHATGDLLLTHVSERLRGCIRKSDLLGRIGGDEFVIALLDIQDAEEAMSTAKRILSRVSEPFKISGNRIHIGASIGICHFPDNITDSGSLIKNADIAMYVAKNEGGNRAHVYTEQMNAAVIGRLEMENGLRKAIEAGEFELHYQPQYDLMEGEMVAIEALIRWNHPRCGRISPDKFIPIAEESRLIIPIGEWVMREACRQNAAWQKEGFRPLRVAVNVSAVQIAQEDFAEMVEKALNESGLSPQCLEVEITETVLLLDRDIVRRNLARLKEMGVTAAIDDFGTGYSSITYLRNMPLDCLKIDQSFIHEASAEEEATALRNQTLIKAFVQLARNLNLHLVAEGVETPGQRRFLKDIGCEIGQGFLFSAPAPAREMESILAQLKEKKAANA
ncbi:MAG: EAL domain-containing protein [Syntrophobacteraceae bacterium]